MEKTLVLLALLPPALMLGLWRKNVPDWRDRFLLASVVWAFCAVVLTEALSIFSAIALPGICLGWVLISIAVVAARKLVGFQSAAGARQLDSPGAGEGRLLILQLGLIAVVLGLLAWIGPPNNWDSLAYHLPRVIHWIQNRNVDFYPTGCLRQLELPPGAEYLILQLQLLSGSDRWDDMVQWFAFAGCVIGVSAIARSLGGGNRAQVFSATFAATLPMACLQSGTSQNDLVSAFWLICFLYFAMALCRCVEPVQTRTAAIFSGASLGLGLLTKSTIYLLAAPFLLGIICVVIWRLRFRSVANLALLALLAVVINAPTYRRNYGFTHTFLGYGGYGVAADGYNNPHPAMRVTASNMIRNLAMEFAIGPQGFVDGLEQSVRRAHRWIGISPDDPDTSINGFAHFELDGIDWNSEDHAPGPFHVLLLLGALATLPIAWQSRNWINLSFAACVIAGFVVFCGYLRLQPWHNRLHLPMLICGAALVGIVAEKSWKPNLSTGLFALLPLLVTPWIFANRLHPLVGDRTIFSTPREEQYFAGRNLLESYRSIVEAAEKNHVRQVALIGDGNCWEYPLQMMLRKHIPQIRINSQPWGTQPGSDELHTANRGFDPNLKPYLIVKLLGETAENAGLVTK